MFLNNKHTSKLNFLLNNWQETRFFIMLFDLSFEFFMKCFAE